MAQLIDLITDTFPASNDTGVPLITTVKYVLQGTNYDEDSLVEGLFIEGPDTDQYTGPDFNLLAYPNNVSQGEIDDFLQSPGYQGLVGGTVTVSGVGGNTEVRFNATRPLAALTEYKMYLNSVLESDGITEVDGIVTVTFETGTGSIEEVPTTTSTSVLQQTTNSSSSTSLEVSSVTPSDRSVENPIDLDEIVIEFNKEIDANSVDSDMISVTTKPATDHPYANVNYQGNLAKVIEVDGKKIIVKI